MTMTAQKTVKISEIKEASYFDIESLSEDSFPLHRYKPIDHISGFSRESIFC